MATQRIPSGLRFITTDPVQLPRAQRWVLPLIVGSLLLAQVRPSGLRHDEAPMVAADNPAKVASGMVPPNFALKQVDTDLALPGQDFAGRSKPLLQQSAAVFVTAPRGDLTLVDLQVRLQI